MQPFSSLYWMLYNAWCCTEQTAYNNCFFSWADVKGLVGMREALSMSSDVPGPIIEPVQRGTLLDFLFEFAQLVCSGTELTK